MGVGESEVAAGVMRSGFADAGWGGLAWDGSYYGEGDRRGQLTLPGIPNAVENPPPRV